MSGTIWEVIAQHGISVAIIGTILCLLYLWFQKRQDRKKTKTESALRIAEADAEAERREKAEKEQRERDKALIEEIIKILNPTHTVEEQAEDLKVNKFIIHQLECLVAEGADRAYMFSLHNGGKDVLGRGLLKMSITQEAVGDNITPIMTKYLNVPRTLFPQLYEQLNERDFYDVDDVVNIEKTDPFTHQFLIEHGAHCAMFRSIKREDGLIIGFIGMEYINKNREDKKKAAKNIDKKANRIMGALVGADNRNGIGG